MFKQEQTQCSTELSSDQSIIDWIKGSVVDANAALPPSSAARALRVPSSLRAKHEEKYFSPRAVSIGPYHFGEPQVQSLEKRKPDFALKLFSNDKEALASLYKQLGSEYWVKELRSFYDENVTSEYCDKVFTRMMLLDSCFILYFIYFVFNNNYFEIGELKTAQIFLVSLDLFLLENQIPFKLLKLVKSLAKKDSLKEIHWHITRAGMMGYLNPKRTWLASILCIGCERRSIREQGRSELEIFGNEPDHLLHLLHRNHTPDQDVRVNLTDDSIKKYKYQGSNFPNVNQLLDVGIRLKPCDTLSLEKVYFSKGRWWFTANVELPPITVDDSTKLVLLNLIAYEMRSNKDSPFISYVSLLQLMISNHEDVRILKDAGVIQSYLGTDKDVVTLFNEVASDLVPPNSTYSDVKEKIERHYEVWSNSPISLVMHEYRKSPWKFISLLGALIALFLTAVQTYFTVWSLK